MRRKVRVEPEAPPADDGPKYPHPEEAIVTFMKNASLLPPAQAIRRYVQRAMEVPMAKKTEYRSVDLQYFELLSGRDDFEFLKHSVYNFSKAFRIKINHTITKEDGAYILKMVDLWEDAYFFAQLVLPKDKLPTVECFYIAFTLLWKHPDKFEEFCRQLLIMYKVKIHLKTTNSWFEKVLHFHSSPKHTAMVVEFILKKRSKVDLSHIKVKDLYNFIVKGDKRHTDYNAPQEVIFLFNKFLPMSKEELEREL